MSSLEATRIKATPLEATEHNGRQLKTTQMEASDITQL
jgi:hypothetical protein